MPRGRKKVVDIDSAKVENKTTAAPGHNSQSNPQAVETFEEYLELDERKKELGKAQRDLRNKAKTEFGILSGVFMHEIKLRKMDRDVRIQFESGHADLKNMLGYQASLDLRDDTIARTEEEFVDPSDPEAEANKLITKVSNSRT